MRAHGGTLAATEISKSHGGDVVLDRVSLVVPPRARIGVVGPNGAGKTTLLRVLAGLEEPDSGRVTRRPGDLTVRYLAQQRERAGLSGGEAARAALREIFDADDDVLLLDEPTNDLDFDGLRLLERFVARTPAAIVVVSHDRAFLEPVVDRIVEFEGETRRVREFAGSWGDYERARETARAAHEAAYERYLGERARFEALRRERQGQAKGASLSQARTRDRRRGPPSHARARVEGACRRATTRAARARRKALGALAPADVDRDARSGRRRRGAPRERRRRARELLGWTGLAGPPPRRPPGDRRPERQRQDDAAPCARRGAAPCRRDAARRPVDSLWRARAGPLVVRAGRASTDAVRRADRAPTGQGASAAREVRAVRGRSDTAGAVPLAGRAHACDACAPLGRGRERSRPRRADEPPRPRGDRGARTRARGLRGDDRAGHARPQVPGGVRARRRR